jgi:hypothetical protein
MILLHLSRVPREINPRLKPSGIGDLYSNLILRVILATSRLQFWAEVKYDCWGQVPRGLGWNRLEAVMNCMSHNSLSSLSYRLSLSNGVVLSEGCV